ncbi:MAG TPA: tRNA glutamyl-Q(34) synthetase GluQRS, partial [Burkholderiaceae bacterium]
QIHLQRLLGLPTPRYLHTPLVLAGDGEKLSKGHGARAIEPGPAALRDALASLDLPAAAGPAGDLLAAAVVAWRARWGEGRDAVA